MRLFPFLLLFLLPQDPPESPNLKPPADVPAEAVEEERKGREKLEEARKNLADAMEIAEQAIDHFRKAVSLAKGKFALASYRIGIACQYTKDYNDARRALEKALQVNPSFHEAVVELGDVWMWKREYPKAVQQYDRAIAMKPDYALAHLNRAVAFTRMGEWARAKEGYEKALQLDEADKSAKHLLGMVEREISGPGFATTYTKETEHFLVQTDVDQRYADWIAQHSEYAYAKYSSIFPKISKGDRKFPVVVFGDVKGYLQYGSPPNTGGYYTDFLKKLVLWKQKTDADTLIVLYHEGFHQFLAYYLTDAPQWFNEGHGDYFGPSVYDAGKKQMQIKVNPWRLPVVQRAIREKTYTPFKKLMLMTQAQLYDPKTIGQNYAQSWSMVYFFWHHENGKYAPPLQKYFQSLRKETSLRQAFDDAFGKVNLDSLEREWRDYVLALKPE